MTFKEKSISQRMSLIKGVLSEVDTSDLIDQHQKLTSIIKGTGVALQSGTERRKSGRSVWYKAKYMQNKQIPVFSRNKAKKKKKKEPS